MADHDEAGRTLDSRMIDYLREGIKRRDAEIEKLRNQVVQCLEIQALYEKKIIELSSGAKP